MTSDASTKHEDRAVRRQLAAEQDRQRAALDRVEAAPAPTHRRPSTVTARHDPGVRRKLVGRVLVVNTRARLGRLRHPTRDQHRDLLILEHLEADILLGHSANHHRYGLAVGGPS